MEDPVPAIAESEASGETAALFGDIRAVLGVGVVNLIWRHLATIEGALPWAWGTLRPAYADGSLAAVAAGLEERLRLPEALPLPPEVAGAVGLDAAARAAVGGVLAAYARTNPLALVALTALMLRLEGASPATAPLGATPRPPAPPATLPLPPLPQAATLTPDVLALIGRLNALGATRPDAVLATMYRHLAHWPATLALAWTVLAPRAADGSLGAAIADCRSAARLAAATLPLPPPAALPAAVRTAVAEALDRFAGEVLPRMVVACGLLRAAWPG
jgi:hypothetical protein